jgi:hypothetical protein
VLSYRSPHCFVISACARFFSSEEMRFHGGYHDTDPWKTTVEGSVVIAMSRPRQPAP